MLQPKKQKYRKQFKPRKAMHMSHRGNVVSFGEFGLQVTEPGLISSRQIEAARRAIVHYIKRGGRVWIRIFPDFPLTKKPPETRMGGGKGDIDQYVSKTKSGQVVFEMSGVSEDVAKEALRRAGHKLPVKNVFIKR